MNDDLSKPINTLYASPSVTTYKNLNPAFRIYEIDPGNKYHVKNFHTYFLNLTSISTNPSTTPIWELLYSAKEEYGMNDLSPESWDSLIDRIIYEPLFYNKFIRNSNRRDDFICDRECRFDSLCFLRKGHHNDTLCQYLLSGSNTRNQFYPHPLNPFKSLKFTNVPAYSTSFNAFYDDGE
ncbi:unnamed protein product, partial [Thelazia callipaeda]|uniref:ASMase_C domain-containing protein n=1 Tax=Thelazia callipaeda TaxID=103827 RepID=A0A0N5CT88_THECL